MEKPCNISEFKMISFDKCYCTDNKYIKGQRMFQWFYDLYHLMKMKSNIQCNVFMLCPENHSK